MKKHTIKKLSFKCLSLSVMVLLSACSSKTDEKKEVSQENVPSSTIAGPSVMGNDDRNLFEVKGDVEKVQTITSRIVDKTRIDFDTSAVSFYEDGIIKTILNTSMPEVKFEHNGSTHNSMYELARNQIGKIKSFSWKVMATPETFVNIGYEYLYNEKGMLSKMISHGIDSRSEYLYQYDGNGRVSKMSIKGEGDGNKWEYEYNYEYIASDQKGNWILAVEKAVYKTHLLNEENDISSSHSTNIVSRKISYYDGTNNEHSKELKKTIKDKIDEIFVIHADDGNHYDAFLSSRLRSAEREKEKYLHSSFHNPNIPQNEACGFFYNKLDAKLNSRSAKVTPRVLSVYNSNCQGCYASVLLNWTYKGNESSSDFVIFKFVQEKGNYVIDDYFDNISSYNTHLDLSYKYGIQNGSFLKKVTGDFNGDGCTEQTWVYCPKYELKDGKINPESSHFQIFSSKEEVKPYKSETGCEASRSKENEYINFINVINLGDINGNGKDNLGILYKKLDGSGCRYTILNVNDNNQWEEIIEPITLYEEALSANEKFIDHIACQPCILKIQTHVKSEDGSIQKVYKQISFK